MGSARRAQVADQPSTTLARILAIEFVCAVRGLRTSEGRYCPRRGRAGSPATSSARISFRVLAQTDGSPLIWLPPSPVAERSRRWSPPSNGEIGPLQ